jgi:hypothetical protein
MDRRARGDGSGCWQRRSCRQSSSPHGCGRRRHYDSGWHGNGIHQNQIRSQLCWVVPVLPAATPGASSTTAAPTTATTPARSSLMALPQGSSRPSRTRCSRCRGDAMPTRARRAATGPFVPERAAAEHPCRHAVCACRRRGPRLGATTRTEGSASPVRVSPWPNPVTRADQGLQDAAVVCRASSRARSRRATGRETAPSVVATGSLAATLERFIQDDLRRHSGPAPAEPGTRGPG